MGSIHKFSDVNAMNAIYRGFVVWNDDPKVRRTYQGIRSWSI